MMIIYKYLIPIKYYQHNNSNSTTLTLTMAANKQIVQLLKSTITKQPKTQQLHLDFMHIKDLSHYMDALGQLKSLKTLSLYGNQIKQLPANMAGLQSLENLDLSNNLISNVEALIASLNTLPKLKTLKLPVKKEPESQIIERVKGLVLLNDLHIVRQPAKKPIKLRHMNQGRLNEFRKQMGRQFRRIKQFQQSYLNQKPTQNTEQKFMSQLQNLIKQSMRNITQKQVELSESLQIIYFTKTKYEIYETIKNRCINIGMDIYGQLGKMIREVWEIQQGLFETVLKEAFKLVKFQYEIKEIQKENRESNQVGLENKIYNRNQQLEKELKRIKKQKDQLIIEINQLQFQNKRYLQSLVKYAKGDKSGFMNISQSQSHNPKPQPQSSHSPTLPQPRIPRSANITRESIPSNYLSSGRSLTLKQLKDTIEQIYESKQKYDQKNFDGKIQRQTMHEYLFTYLNQKYGLKNLTIQAASSIVGGIQGYSAEDNDVAVFGKILRNQIDEQFRNVQYELKSTINNLLKMHIKSQAPFKSAGQIEAMFKQKTNGQISSQQIQDIVKYLYNKIDSDRILHKIQLLYRLNKPKQQAPNRRQLHSHPHDAPNDRQKKRLKFSIFVKAVLDFQLRNHERLLKPLVSVFKARDRDADGIVKEDQFIEIVEELCQEAKDVLPEMLMIVDPNQTGFVTFTQVVKLMANYPENNPVLSRFVEKEDYLDDFQ